MKDNIQKKYIALHDLEITYSEDTNEIVLVHGAGLNYRLAHQEVLDAVVRMMEFENLESIKINSRGKNYKLWLDKCK